MGGRLATKKIWSPKGSEIVQTEQFRSIIHIYNKYKASPPVLNEYTV